MFLDRIKDEIGFHPPQADIGAHVSGDRPRKTPAVAVEHGQCPKIHGVMRHAPGDDVAYGVEVSPAVVINHTLGIAGGAGSVIERDLIPFIGWARPGKIGVAFL
jgi:hypothetical protein